MNLRKLLGRIHLWLGLASGLVVLVLSVTGCVYVFEKELKSLVYADRLRVEPRPGEKFPLGALWEKAQGALGGQYRINGARVPMSPDGAYEFSSYKSDDGAWTYFGSVAHYRRAFLDPYDGRVLATEDAELEFFNLVLWLHWSLLLSTGIGQPIVGTAVLLFVVQLMTGMALWWPRSRAALKARLSVAWTSSPKRRTWDLHAVLGFYASAVALVIALTGLVWAFQWVSKSVYFVATGGGSPAQEAPVHSDTTQAAGAPPLDLVFLRHRESHPQARELYIHVPEERSGTLSIFAKLEEGVNYRHVYSKYDRYSGLLLKSDAYDDMDRGEKLNAMNYDIHVGAVLGLPGKILAFLGSFICGTLPITGFLIWRGRRKKVASKPVTRAPADQMVTSGGSPR